MNKWAAAFRVTGIGFYVAACILSGVFSGLWLDGKFRTGPLFVLLGLALGLVVAIYGVYRMIRPLMDEKPDKENG